MVWLVLKDQGKLTIIVNTTQIWVMQSHVYTMFNYVHFYIEINVMMLFWILFSYEFLICFGITLLKWCQLPTCIFTRSTFVVSIPGPSWSESVPIITKVVNQNPSHGEMYLIQHYVISLPVSSGRWWFSPGTQVFSTNKTDNYDITEIVLNVALNTITLTF
jgi:hypothetical protein